MIASLTPEILVLLIIESDGGHLSGKTLLQKRAFFLCEHLECSASFDAHFYGPYSPTIDSTLGRMKSLGLIQEQSQGFGRADNVGLEWRRYEFALTEDGRRVLAYHEAREPAVFRRVRDYLQEMHRAGDNGDYINLSIAAKTFFILKREQKQMGRDELQAAARNLGWKIDPTQIENAGQFLERLGLTVEHRQPKTNWLSQ